MAGFVVNNDNYQ